MKIRLLETEFFFFVMRTDRQTNMMEVLAFYAVL